METIAAPCIESQLTDIVGLRLSGIFPKNKEPSIRTLREWTKLRRIPHHRVGHFVYYDPCHTASAEASTLLVEASNGESWLLPWQHFLAARRQTVDGGERLALEFATSEVVIAGRNLAVLVDEIARSRLDGIRPAPSKYQRSSSADAFVTKVEVKARTEVGE